MKNCRLEQRVFEGQAEGKASAHAPPDGADAIAANIRLLTKKAYARREIALALAGRRAPGKFGSFDAIARQLVTEQIEGHCNVSAVREAFRLESRDVGEPVPCVDEDDRR